MESSRHTRRELGVLAGALVCAPFLLGARGCVSELDVGVQKVRPAQDAGLAIDGGTTLDASASGPCASDACTGQAPDPRSCSDGSQQYALCERSAAGTCTWILPECPSADAGNTGEPPPCQELECHVILIAPLRNDAGAPSNTDMSCTDGSAPKCQRDTSTGVCVLKCPPTAACTLDADCGADQFCATHLGLCGQTSQDGFCQAKPQTCPSTSAPVCGCDGQTYSNACEATRAGVSIAFEAGCDVKPQACTSCTGPAPAVAATVCPDGTHQSGPVCLKNSDGTCGYQLLTCPAAGACSDTVRAALVQNACWSDADCSTGQTCVGASVCPCNTECFAPDRAGTCM